jgi:hypothetical protein
MKILRIILYTVFGIILAIIILYQIIYRDICTEIYVGTYKNKKVKVESILHQGLIINYESFKLKLEGQPTISIDAHTTNLNSVPYSFDVFGDAKHMFLDTTIKYQNKLVFDDTLNASMLYFDTKTFNLNEYKEYEGFFKSEWQNVVAEMKKSNRSIRNYIIGTLYGDKDDFVMTFRGLDNGVMYNLDIAADGNVQYHEEVGSLGFTGTGLSQKVQMPGKILYYKPNQLRTIDFFKELKHKNGKKLSDYFTIIEKEDF